MRDIKVGDKVRVIRTDHLENFSKHLVGDEFIVGEVYYSKWLRTSPGVPNGIPKECVELVEKTVNNTYELY